MLKTYKLVYPVLLAGLFLSTTLVGAGKIKPPVDTKKMERPLKMANVGSVIAGLPMNLESLKRKQKIL